LLNSNKGPITIKLTVEVQKLFPTSHKALSLIGGGRDSRKSFEQQNQQYAQHLDHTIEIKPHKILNILATNLLCSCYILLLQVSNYHMATSGSRKVARILMVEDEEFMEIDTLQGSAHKRTTWKTKELMEKNSKKKNRSEETQIVTMPDRTERKLWFGFSYMEQFAIEAEILECMDDGPVEDLVAKGYIRTEAEELEQAIVSFPRVSQKLYPSTRKDKVLGQHYNLTQIPFEIATNLDTGLSLDFHITIYFEQPKTPYEHDEILAKAQERFEQMSIPLGTDILHPITVLCKHTKQKEEPRI
jgi:hypothetical protein